MRIFIKILSAELWYLKDISPPFSFQYFIYASYFAAISLLFTVRGVYSVLRMKRSTASDEAEGAPNLPEGSHLWWTHLRTPIALINYQQQKYMFGETEHTCMSRWSIFQSETVVINLSFSHQQGFNLISSTDVLGLKW